MNVHGYMKSAPWRILLNSRYSNRIDSGLIPGGGNCATINCQEKWSTQLPKLRL